MIVVAVEIVGLAIVMAIESARYYPSKIPDKEHPGSHTIVSLV